MKIVKEDPSLGTNGIAEAQKHRGVPSRECCAPRRTLKIKVRRIGCYPIAEVRGINASLLDRIDALLNGFFFFFVTLM